MLISGLSVIIDSFLFLFISSISSSGFSISDFFSIIFLSSLFIIFDFLPVSALKPISGTIITPLFKIILSSTSPPNNSFKVSDL